MRLNDSVKQGAKHRLRGFMPRNRVAPYEMRSSEVCKRRGVFCAGVNRWLYSGLFSARFYFVISSMRLSQVVGL